MTDSILTDQLSEKHTAIGGGLKAQETATDQHKITVQVTDVEAASSRENMTKSKT